MDSNLKIMVVCGGISSERDVSLRSGQAVFNALCKHGFSNVELFDLREDNAQQIIKKRPDIAYLALHGIGGEDGSVQGMLELAGIPYTGPGVACSAVCMNKILTKNMLYAASIPTPAFLNITYADQTSVHELAQRFFEKVGLPMVLKSPSQGSSIGVIIVHEESEIEPAISEILKLDNQIMAEEFVDGIEITVPIIGNDEPVALPEIEITSECEFYNYEAKYTSGMCHHIIPARIDEDVRSKVREISIATYRALNCRGISRIDMIINKENEPMVIEVNTLPGMTEMSLVPDSAKAAGISFGELNAKILKYGYDYAQKQRNE